MNLQCECGADAVKGGLCKECGLKTAWFDCFFCNKELPIDNIKWKKDPNGDWHHWCGCEEHDWTPKEVMNIG